ncbi:hypothetical protein F4561_005653 [Lipingzhangella halophila]|uniref:Uncharacterized protein n=1 Tax=Lipingzhangella halophila TaxID=1783352 RepID=A0A7W7RMM0_9ACTN|nr:hypothetical protein [Lipingzhangella halophila]MBB4934759.1 hypothetical protein [Lipingzhangella halophila]
MSLTHRELHTLRDLIDELIAATEDHTYCLGPVRDTSLELRELLTSHDSESLTVERVTANWKCPVKDCQFASITPMSHPCPLR